MASLVAGVGAALVVTAGLGVPGGVVGLGSGVTVVGVGVTVGVTDGVADGVAVGVAVTVTVADGLGVRDGRRLPPVIVVPLSPESVWPVLSSHTVIAPNAIAKMAIALTPIRSSTRRQVRERSSAVCPGEVRSCASTGSSTRVRSSVASSSTAGSWPRTRCQPLLTAAPTLRRPRSMPAV